MSYCLSSRGEPLWNAVLQRHNQKQGELEMPAWKDPYERESEEEYDLSDLGDLDDGDVYAKCVDDEGGVTPFLDGYDVEAFGDELEEDDFDEEEELEER
jgi:hypothetical protein